MWIEILLFFLLVVAYLYYIITKNFDEFKDSGIPYSKPYFPFGSYSNMLFMLKKVKFNEVEKLMVDTEFPNVKVFGFFQFGQPNIVINDEELAKRILIKDFEHFVDRRQFTFAGVTKSSKINSKFLTNLSGDEWKKVRSLMSGVFTSGKLKNMARHIVKVGQQLENHLELMENKGDIMDAKVLGGMFTLDAIATSGFGIESDSFKEPDNIFRKMALRLFNRGPFFLPKIILALTFPKLVKILKLSFIDQQAMEFFADIVEKTYKQRMATGEKRNDIIDILVEELDTSEKKGNNANMTDTEFESEFEKDAALDTSTINAETMDKELLMVSNALIFFFAGFDTSSTGLCVIVHFLINNPEMQERVIAEIDDILNGSEDVTFSKIQEMKYLDQFVSECSRLQPFIGALERQCTKDYLLPGTNYTVKKGTIVKVYGRDMATDNKNFSSPLTFNPDNFLPENNPNKFAVTMFGQGPRNCIGMRYAILALKICIVFMLRKFRVVKCSKTKKELTMNESLSFEAWFKLEKRV